ncbi:MAG: hypothetical protein WC150_00875 [Bacteroidia bacterium]
MKVSPRSHIWILFMIAVLGLFSCKSSMQSKSVFGGKKGNLKSVFQRYQSRDFKAKNEEKKQQNKQTDEQEGNPTETPTPVTVTAPAIPNTATIENPELTLQEKITVTDEMPDNANVTEEIPTTAITDELAASQDYSEKNIANEVLSASVHTAKNISVKAIKSITKQASSGNQKEGIAKTAHTNFIALPGIYKKFYNGDFRTGLKELKIKAEKKGKSYLWVLYFAIAQAFTAMFLGFKNIFQMLDTPSDAGNKALGISYASIAILTIHTLLLVGLVKNFM